MKNYSISFVRISYSLILFLIFDFSLKKFVFGNSPTAIVIFVFIFLITYIFDMLNFTTERFRIRNIIYFFCIDFFFMMVFYSSVKSCKLFIVFFMLFLSQIFLTWIFHKLFFHKYKLIIYGKDDKNFKILEFLLSSSIYKFSGYFSMKTSANVLYKGDIFEMKKVILSKDADVILITADELNEDELDVLIELKISGIQIITYSEFAEKIEKKIDLTRIDKNWLIESSGFSLLHNRTQQRIKRILDILISIIFLMLFFPLMIFVGILIILLTGKPVFFKQKRVGLKNEVFNIYKFRTMKIHNENKFSKYAQENDPRITKFGNFLRKSRIDELPQLFCILKGDMSFVGPRPEWNKLALSYSEKISYYNFRHIVKPGITGWAQVMYPYGDSLEDTYNKLGYDLFYIKYQEIILDIVIILKTIKIVLFAKGR